jgi:site-specific DNA-cytosine methylase
LVACEESQAVCIEFRRLGIEAYSCDILPCSGGHSEWHIQQDVTELLKQKWDMIIAFPPCTYLSSAQMGWYNIEKYGEKAIQRYKDQDEAIEFFMMFVNADCEKIAIENPVGIMSSKYRKPDQIIQPWQFGDEAQKATCLWLKGLPKLQPTDIVGKGEKVMNKRKDGRVEYRAAWFLNSCETWKMSADERRTKRSKTFKGIAKAMATQWTEYLLSL